MSVLLLVAVIPSLNTLVSPLQTTQFQFVSTSFNISGQSTGGGTGAADVSSTCYLVRVQFNANRGDSITGDVSVSDNVNVAILAIMNVNEYTGLFGGSVLRATCSSILAQNEYYQNGVSYHYSWSPTSSGTYYFILENPGQKSISVKFTASSSRQIVTAQQQVLYSRSFSIIAVPPKYGCELNSVPFTVSGAEEITGSLSSNIPVSLFVVDDTFYKSWTGGGSCSIWKVNVGQVLYLAESVSSLTMDVNASSPGRYYFLFFNYDRENAANVNFNAGVVGSS